MSDVITEHVSTEPVQTCYDHIFDRDDKEMISAIKDAFPSLDYFAIQVALRNHKKCCEIYGDDYSIEDFNRYLEDVASSST